MAKPKHKLLSGSAFVLKILLSGGLVIWLVARSDLRQILATLAHLSVPVLAAVVFLYLASMVINAYKWQVLLGHHRLRDLLLYILIAQYYSMVFPGQIAGEAVKVYKLGRSGCDTERIAASVAVDRLTGLTAVALVALAGILVSSSPVGEGYILALCLVLTVVFAGLYFLHNARVANIVKGLVAVLTRPLPHPDRWQASIFGFIDAWRNYLRRPGLLSAALVLGVLLQLVCVAINLMIARDIGIGVSFADWCWIFGIVSMIVFLPVTVGGLGVREGGFVFLLSLFGIAGDKALALSFTVFGIQVLGALLGGILDLSLAWKRPE
jgi:uncharacterized protein (TIRG00374 family)